MKKYDLLKELINAWIEREKENIEECHGIQSAQGALNAYRQVLFDIEELEQEVTIPKV